MKNKVLKAVLAVMLIIAITMVDFIFLGMNLITYALENLDNTTNNSNVKFTAYFKTEDEEKVSQMGYEINSTEMKLYMEVAVENSGYFDGVIILDNSNFMMKSDSLSKNIGSIEGNTITLNRVRSGNAVEIEVGIEPILVSENYFETMLTEESTLTIRGDYYQDDTEESIEIETNKKVTLSLFAPEDLDTTLNGKVLTNRIYKIGEVNKRLVQIELNSTVVDNAYPIKATTFDISLPEGVEKVEVISKGTYATNGEAEAKLEETSYQYNAENNTIRVFIDNSISKDGRISWYKNVRDIIIVTLILSEDQEIGEENYTAKAKVEFYGEEEKEIEKEITYNLNKEADGIIRTFVENEEEIYKGKLYSKEEREYKSTTNLEINYENLIESATAQEKTTYRVEKESEDIEANIQYKTTTVSKEEVEKILGEVGKLVIKDQEGNEVKTITKDTEADEDGNIVITHKEGVKELSIEITKAISTGIIRLKHSKVIKPQELSDKEINELKYLVEQAAVKYNTAEYDFEGRKELKEVKSEVALTVTPQTLSAEENKEMQIAITLKTEHEKYQLFDNPSFTITMPEGVKINSLSNGEESVLYGGLTLSKIERVSERKIKIEIAGKQTEYVKSNINTQIKFTANVAVEKLMPNKTGVVNMQYQNQGNTYEVKSQEINIITSNSKIVTHIEVENYNGKGATLEKYSDNTEEVIGELPVGIEEAIKIPAKYAIINNYNSSIALTATIIATFVDKDGNVKELINSDAKEITIEAGTMQVIEQTLEIPAKLYYSEKIDIETRVEYTYGGTENIINNNIKLATEEKNGNRDITTIDDKIKVETFAQLGDGTALRAVDEVYNEQIVKYIIKVTNISDKEITNLKVTNEHENGNIYDLKEVWVTNYVVSTEKIMEHRYAELDTNIKTFEIENLKPGESTELISEVVVKKTEESNVTSANITIASDEMQGEKLLKISNTVKDAEIKITTEKALNEEVEKYGTETLHILSYVKNLTDNKINNKNVKIYLSKGLSWKEGYRLEALNTSIEKTDILGKITYNEQENYLEFELLTLEANEEICISAFLQIESIPLEESFTEEKVYVQINDIVSNSTTIKVKQLETTISISQSVNIAEGQKVKDGESVIITGDISNNGYTDAVISIQDDLPDGLEISKVEIIKEDKIIDETPSDKDATILIGTGLNKGEKITLKIETILNTSKTIESELKNKIYIMPSAGETIVSNEIIVEIESNVDNSTGLEKPDTPEPEEPKEEEKEFTISGHAWVDKDEDGIKDISEVMKDVIVKIIDLNNNNMFLKDKNGYEIEALTDENGAYEIKEIPKGNYNVIFKYDTNSYELKENSGLKDYIIEGTQEKVAITNNINLETDQTIDLELIELKEFNLKIDKYISKAVVQNSNGTKTSTYTKQQLVKEEIQKKYLPGTIVLVEYTMEISNIGELAGYATEIIDYLPKYMEFHSELNTQWYEEEDGNLYNTALASTMINPGETKTIKLILSKTMTDENVGTTSNIVEIAQTMNSKGYDDIDSNNNQSKAEIIVNPATGTVITYLVAILNSILILFVGIYIIKRNVIGKEKK